MSPERSRRDSGLVLIAAFSNWEGLSRLPWLLHRAGSEVEVFSPPGAWVAESSWVSRHIEAPATLDAYIDALGALLACAGEGYRWVVLGDDPLLYGIGNRRREAWARALLPCRADDASIDFLVSKVAFLEGCRKAGIRVPEFQICQTPADIPMAGRALGYPLVLKGQEGFGGRSLQVLRGPQEPVTIDCSRPFVAQAWVSGPVCSAAAFFDHGTLAGFHAYRRTRTWGRFGASTAVTFDEFPGLQRLLQALGELSGFHGLCGIDLILDSASGELVLLEQNFRPTLTMLLGRRAGADLVPCVRQALQGQPVQQPLLLQDPHCRLMVPLFPSDLLRAIDGNDILGVLRWCVLPGYWREMHWHDPKARVHALREVLRAFGRKLTRTWYRLKSTTAGAPRTFHTTASVVRPPSSTLRG